MFYTDIRLFIAVFLVLALFITSLYFKKKIGQELVIAIFFALFITSYVETIYEGFNLTLGRINIFPFIAWTAAFVFLREIYKQMKMRYKFFIVSFIYIVALFLIEYVGYYKLNIRSIGNYQSLFGIGIIHGPIIIYIFYLTAGPIYLLVTDYLRVE